MAASGQLAPGTAQPSIRDLAIKHANNPMTVSKVYSLLESEGVLERHRGKPMTVAPRRGRTQAPRAARLKELEPQLEHLILAARQLELEADDVIEALQTKWEVSDGPALRGRARTR
jgi:GntR family transcriptional regulator